ncbi:MAG: hypothetical protein NWE84_09150 [Candidatus Bathyarchaeota archaeon]|nr:hypothetical protein [Candidatus Bathyarchaeota archaeon]
MNKRHIGLIVYLVSVSLTATVAFSFSIAERDVFWIGEVENWIRRENWEPDREYVPSIFATFFLFDINQEVWGASQNSSGES